MRKNPHVRICGGLGSATALVYPTGPSGYARIFVPPRCVWPVKEYLTEGTLTMFDGFQFSAATRVQSHPARSMGRDHAGRTANTTTSRHTLRFAR